MSNPVAVDRLNPASLELLATAVAMERYATMNYASSIERPAAEVTEYEWLARVEALRSLIVSYRAELAAGPDLPAPIAGALIDAGLAELWLARSLGGPAVEPATMIRVIEALAMLDGSVAWCAAISGGGILRVIDAIGAGALHELVPAGEKIAAAGSGQPTGTAVREGDEWIINGRWSWGSFSRYAKVIGVTCIEMEDGVPRRSPDGKPVIVAAILPPAAVEIVGNWNAGGLKASGSHDLICRDVRAPDRHVAGMAQFMVLRLDAPLTSLPMSTAATIASLGIPLGLAAAAIDALIKLASEKTPFGSDKKLAEREDVQIAVARAQVTLDAVRGLAFAVVADIWDTALRSDPISIEQQAAVARMGQHATEAARSIIGAMYDAAGSTAVLEELPFSRIARDIAAVSQHVAFQSRRLIPAGRILLGLAPNSPAI